MEHLSLFHYSQAQTIFICCAKAIISISLVGEEIKLILAPPLMITSLTITLLAKTIRVTYVLPIITESPYYTPAN